MEPLRFSIPEILALAGVAQCVYVLVYMAFRSGNLKSVILPFVYFFILGSALALDFAGYSLSSVIPHHEVWQWALWFSGPPLSVLLVGQIIRLTHLPGPRHFLVLLLMPLAFAVSVFLAKTVDHCIVLEDCASFADWLTVMGLIAGTLSMAVIWVMRKDLNALAVRKDGRDRYWLTLTLVFMNLLFLGVMLLGLGDALAREQEMIVRALIGLGFAYVAGTSLFRIYPQAVILVKRGKKPPVLSQSERELAMKIESLLDLEKVYHEPAFDRSRLARELTVPETVISKVINLHFGKSLPQILNERRVDDAKRLLAQTDAAVKVIAEEVGFNSLASFNRVFKDMTGLAPGEFRSSQPNNSTAKK